MLFALGSGKLDESAARPYTDTVLVSLSLTLQLSLSMIW